MVTMQKAAETQDRRQRIQIQRILNEGKGCGSKWWTCRGNSGQVSRKRPMMELPLTTTGLFHLMKICQQAAIPVDSLATGVVWIVAPGGGDEESEFFTITEMGPILMIMGADTVIRRWKLGRCQWKFISYLEWRRLSFRNQLEQHELQAVTVLLM